MIAVDTNVLIHAHRPDATLHVAARTMLSEFAHGSASWAIPWPCIHEFYSVATNPRIWPMPTPPENAWLQIDAWLDSPTCIPISEARDHRIHLRKLTQAAATKGGQVHGARIAAICMSHGVSELITLDRDFSRFPQLRTRGIT